MASTAAKTSSFDTLFSRIPLGKYCRSNPLLFSFKPRSQLWYGQAKNPWQFHAWAMVACPLNSRPLSYVMVWVQSFHAAKRGW